MNKKLMIVLTAVLVLLLILAISLGIRKDTPADLVTESAIENPTIESAVESSTDESAVESSTDESAVESSTVGSVMETPETIVPGMEDSIFDLPSEELVAQIQTEDLAETKSTVTVPDGPVASTNEDGNDSEGKIEAPAAPKSSNKSEAVPPAATDEKESQTPAFSEYEKFQNMGPAEQQAYMESFEDIEAFFAWYDKAKAEYEAANPFYDVGDGKIDLKDYE